MSIYPCEELIEDIFERLPPKTLLRFRSLSKSWYSCISSPDFIHRHRSRSVEKNLIRHHNYQNGSPEDIFTLHSEEQLPLCPVNPYKNITPVKLHGRYPVIVGSCNGILCLFDFADDDCRLCLWNFSIRRKLTLPDHPYLRSNCKAPPQVLVGFGFDPIANDYKIVCTSYSEFRVLDETKSVLYSLKTNSWSEIASPTTQISKEKSHQACFVNGTLHWVVRYYNNYDLVIMTFHLSTHVFGTIALPEPRWYTRNLTIINSSLAVTSRYTCRYNSDFERTCTWVRSEYDNVAIWSIVYDHQTTDLSRLIKFRDTGHMEIEAYVESLELLDKGTLCGETISWKKKENKKT